MLEFLDRVCKPESIVEKSYEITNSREDLYKTAIEDHIIMLEIIINKPFSKLNTPIEANLLP